VAQAVVDQVVRLHHARVESSGGGGAVRDGVASVANSRKFGRISQKGPNKKWSGRTNLRPNFGRF
jgi:hypothetical protein